MRTFRRRAAAGLTGLCALLTGCTPAVHAEGKESAPHGALGMAQQTALLDKFDTSKDGAPPSGVDESAWRALIPADNAPSAARVALGRALFFDLRLSQDGTVACATCHDVSKGFSDRRGTSEGVGDKLGRRNAPTPLNAALLQTQFWDGRAATLEEQAKLPIINPIEMAHPTPEAATRAIAGDASYKQAFQSAYGRDVNYEDIGRAIAAFERTLIFLDAPFDRFVAGDARALTTQEQRGFALFQGKARCVGCHQFNSANPIGTNNKFHNIGVSARHKDFEELARRALAELEKSGSKEQQDRLALETDLSELGRFVVTKSRADIGAFRTSQLRNVGVTAPYMHDGSLGTLWDVVDHYNKGGEANPYLDGGIEPLSLSDAEVDDLVAFMFALSDVRFKDANEAERARQRGLAEKKRPFREEARAARSILTFETRLTAQKAKAP